MISAPKKKIYDAVRYLEIKESVKAKSREYYQANKERINLARSEDKKRYYRAHREKFLGYRLARCYGMTVETYKKILSAQDHKCAICRAPFSTASKGEGPHVDHCHTENRIRGIICHNCNTALGLFRDSIPAIESALSYLKAVQSQW